jgi:Mitogen-activated protein kinase kinase 1 interacting
VLTITVRSEMSESQREYMLKPNLLAASGATIEQGSKIGLGKTKTVTAVFSNYQVI